MTDKIGDMLRFHQQALALRGHRQQLIASNIANADTPNFKARDIDFKSALANALGGKAGSPPLMQTSTRHLQAALGGLNAQVQYRTETQSSVDGNTVNVDLERGQFAENAVYYEAALTFVNGQLRSLQTAIQGQ
jgi:flagellar basal-body rod protein FlgB